MTAPVISKDVERLVRGFMRQKLDPEYIRYYLEETWQLDRVSIDQLFERLGVGRKPGVLPGQEPKKPAPGANGKISKQKFF